MANPGQEDFDSDGRGDACDDEMLLFADGFESGDTSAWSAEV